MSKQIVLVIKPDGEITVEAQGFKGRTCKDATRFLEEALGETTEIKYKAEFYQKEVSQQHARNSLRS